MARRVGVTMSIMMSWVTHVSQGRPLFNACSDSDSAGLCLTWASLDLIPLT